MLSACLCHNAATPRSHRTRRCRGCCIVVSCLQPHVSDCVPIQALGEKAVASTNGTKIRLALLPYSDIQRHFPPGDVRSSISQFASHAGLCYSIMGGVSASAMVSLPPDTDTPVKVSFDAAVSLLDLTSVCAWLQTQHLGYPLFTASFFFCMQGLMSSMLILGWVNVVPDEKIGAFVRDAKWTIACSGWMLVPSVVSFGAAVVSSTAQYHPAWTAVGLLGYAGLGVMTTMQTAHLGWLVPRLRQECYLAPPRWADAASEPRDGVREGTRSCGSRA